MPIVPINIESRAYFKIYNKGFENLKLSKFKLKNLL